MEFSGKPQRGRIEKNDNRLYGKKLYVSGFKYREIAVHLGLPIGTVKSRIFFTRQRLQKDLKDFR